jgi:hypothetical protein
MSYRPALRIWCAAAALGFLLGCAPAPRTAGSPPGPGAPLQAGACTNGLYPVVKGATWTYASTGGPAGSFTYTDTITDVGPDRFTLTSQFNQLTRTQEWACKPEGLTALQLGGSAAGVVTASDVSVQLTTANVQGITIPAHVAAGDRWPYSLDFEGTAEVAGASAEEKGSASFQFTAAGMEPVTVPAGTFDAMKIEIESTFDIQITLQGFSAPTTITGHSTVWYAPGVGMIKSMDVGQANGNTFTATTELQSYTIP